MLEKELIVKLKALKDIKPRQDWVVSVKTQLLGRELASREQFSASFWSMFEWKPFAVTAVGALVVLLVFVFSQRALPGDPLFAIKKAAEQGQNVFVAGPAKSQFNLELANKRLKDLVAIAKSNQGRKLAPAISEFQANVKEAAKDLANVSSTSSDKVAMQKIVEQTKKLAENRQKIEAMGIVLGDTEEFDTAISKLVEREIKEMENNDLTDNQPQAVSEIRDILNKGDYSQALEKLLLMLP